MVRQSQISRQIREPEEFFGTELTQRRGRLRSRGRGTAPWVVPGFDRAFLIPSSVQSAAFLADQVTVENQGVEIGGFALDRLGEQLRAVLEAAIRREAANLTLEQVLRQRAAMTHLLGDELAGIAQRWGLAIAAVEIRSVQVLSMRIFENLQAKFRELAGMRRILRRFRTHSRLPADADSSTEEAIPWKLLVFPPSGRCRRSPPRWRCFCPPAPR